MTHSGWRKPTPGLLQAERFAEVGEQLSVPKTQAIVAVKKVAAAIGLKSQDLLLLDTFGAVTQPQDWEQGRRPIVWASNHFLMEQTGFSLATLRRHVRRLCEVGVISMKDSPNGKRWGYRDAEGAIVEAYGFDLAPMAARAEEFEHLYAHLQAERKQCAFLRNAITVARRAIRAKIDQAIGADLRGRWDHFKEALGALLESLPGRSERAGGLASFLERIRALQVSVDRALQKAFDAAGASEVRDVQETGSLDATSRKMKPTGIENDAHILTTNELNPVTRSCFEKGTTAEVGTPEHTVLAPLYAGEGDVDLNWDAHGSPKRSDIDIPMLMASCPHFAEMARGTNGYMRNWNDVHRAAATLRPMVGISEDAWNTANKVLGPADAAASVALILDKSADGEVRSPGGYLRGLVERAKVGELHLNRSLYGRLSGAGG